jgi:hypothetical protein
MNEKQEQDAVEKITKTFDAEEVGSESIVLEPFEKVVGRFVGYEDGLDNKGRTIKLINIETESGKVNMAIPTTLTPKLKNVKENETIAILRITDGITKDGSNSFKNFRVYRLNKKGKK